MQSLGAVQAAWRKDGLLIAQTDLALTPDGIPLARLEKRNVLSMRTLRTFCPLLFFTERSRFSNRYGVAKWNAFSPRAKAVILPENDGIKDNKRERWR